MKSALVLRGHRTVVNALAMAADGRLASGGRGGEVMLWDLKAPIGRQLVRLAGSGPEVHCIMSVTGDRIIVTGGGGMAKIWPLSVDPLLARAEAVVGRNLTQIEWPLYFPGKSFRPTFSKIPSWK